MSAPIGGLDLFRESLATALADAIGIPLNAVEAAVEIATEGWSVEVHHMRPITDHHTRYAIHTPWAKVEEEVSPR